MINRYITKSFNNNVNPTFGAAFFTCKINLDNARVKFQVSRLTFLIYIIN
jgi:Ras-related protein Rab-21